MFDSSPNPQTPRLAPFGRTDRPTLSVVSDNAAMHNWYERHERGRELSRDELDLLVHDLARHPDLWEGQIHHSPDERFYVQLLLNDHVDVWLICWCPTQDTGFHDHAGSRGAVAVVEGALAETLLTIGGAPRATIHGRGSRFSFGATHIHDVQHSGREAATSLHAYSPPLGDMGFYDVLPDGTITRRVGDYREEFC
jgi:predicted metal-dependent enzyme (double-stranded beta helix superfamily)